ncbi:hypothetical protein BDZ97DRAFT_1835620 [Flammula alnicola]|nr:hypothetical protein BDZ97DRAFT_1835620 [Flammula alnicola]
MKYVFVRNRLLCKGVPFEIMDRESQEMQEFEVTVFDKYGNVRPWLINGGRRTGSGCWGTELNQWLSVFARYESQRRVDAFCRNFSVHIISKMKPMCSAGQVRLTRGKMSQQRFGIRRRRGLFLKNGFQRTELLVSLAILLIHTYLASYPFVMTRPQPTTSQMVPR